MSFYFAYGSNMNPARMRSRGLAFSEALAGRLEGYTLCFNKRAHDRPGRSYANIRYQRGGVVEGVLYRLEHEDEIWKMDPFEGTPIFYSRERMPVVTAGGVQPAWVYVANPSMREDGLWPTRSYLEHLLAGREFLTPAYWEDLAAVPAHPDE
ncbi:gamma-glutamylcyclotransferase family protein [Pseudomonas sp. JS3066]|uniref:gamma-glutamylcyclotransferase family protein n=1 Tax=Pseudomonas sp. JS3066 TaxID=3090665 RepID=UPI002E7B7B4D|nr:gamma-glutamylcyclotransferase family protein [Pseudomonas sp. JS3066]WVK91358.1 gamma-glutamylcyclotransferase family protein [Pseudomonas sp. JS3066]